MAPKPSPKMEEDDYLTVPIDSRGAQAYIESLVKIEKSSFGKADSWADNHGQELKSNATKRSNVLVVCHSGRAPNPGDAIGYAIVSCSTLRVHLMKIAIHPDHRRKGLATKIITACAKVATARRAQVFSLYVDPANMPAYMLYTIKLGFNLDSILADYYGPGRPAHYLTKNMEDAKD